ncbi:DNA cytosine methyltransferase [Sphingomonas sp. C8-2]|uniref:DNA (cytosine-5-)-methyltransferase n=1 Tax=Sphingobium jiangsuense TaxID=870476 RepID=A0A7W6FQ65_9SPHN|nr:DNA cytosine methyltransferase [Sphingobium jiangsuense]MBB3926352.1 DNA (cytosine-5)-methyltransferase 1 [Sphingobium jiangsuense]QEH80874.1 DNA cytosine methyltransferase [Sphingomonas sp. C8-2]
MMRALDLFSAAAGGWSLGLHRAGFVTVAACEIIEWRRILYAENNPHVRLYADVRDLTAARLLSDLGMLPDIIVGSPPCQDISSANTKGKGIDGERSGLYLEAIRLVGDCRPRWFAFENSANLRTRGADRLLDALETLGYACEPCVVGAGDVGANHVRKRSWLIGYDPEQLADAGIQLGDEARRRLGSAPEDGSVGPVRVLPRSETAHAAHQRRRARPGNVQGSWREAHGHEPADDVAPGGTEQTADPDGIGRDDGRCGRRGGIDISATDDPGDAPQVGRGSGRSGRCPEPVAGSRQPSCGDDADAGEAERRPSIERPGDRDGAPDEWRKGADRYAESAAPRGGNPADPDEARQPDGRLESGLRPEEIADDGRGDGRGNDRPGAGQMGGREGAGGDAAEPWADWNGGLAHHLWLDDGLSAWVADTRIAIGGPRGTSAASLIVEAFGDAVLPQVPEAIGRAILRTEAALDLVFGRTSIDIPGEER